MAHKTPSRRGRFCISVPLQVMSRMGNVSGEDTFTENFSAGGCYFLLSQQPEIGSELEIEITMPEGFLGRQQRRLRCRAEVVRVETGPQREKAGVACAIRDFSFPPAQAPAVQRRQEAPATSRRA